MIDLLIKGGLVVTPGKTQIMDIGIHEGKILFLTLDSHALGTKAREEGAVVESPIRMPSSSRNAD